MSSVIGARLETRGEYRTSVVQLPPVQIFRFLVEAYKEWGTVAFLETPAHNREIAAVEKGEGYKGVNRFAVTSPTVSRLSYKDREKISRDDRVRAYRRLSSLIGAPIPVYASSLYVQYRGVEARIEKGAREQDGRAARGTYLPNSSPNIAEAARRTSPRIQLEAVDRIRAYRSNFEGSTGENVEPARYGADHDWIKDTLRLRHASPCSRKPLATCKDRHDCSRQCKHDPCNRASKTLSTAHFLSSV